MACVIPPIPPIPPLPLLKPYGFIGKTNPDLLLLIFQSRRLVGVILLSYSFMVFEIALPEAVQSVHSQVITVAASELKQVSCSTLLHRRNVVRYQAIQSPGFSIGWGLFRLRQTAEVGIEPTPGDSRLFRRQFDGSLP